MNCREIESIIRELEDINRELDRFQEKLRKDLYSRMSNIQHILDQGTRREVILERAVERVIIREEGGKASGGQ